MRCGSRKGNRLDNFQQVEVLKRTNEKGRRTTLRVMVQSKHSVGYSQKRGIDRVPTNAVQSKSDDPGADNKLGSEKVEETAIRSELTVMAATAVGKKTSQEKRERGKTEGWTEESAAPKIAAQRGKRNRRMAKKQRPSRATHGRSSTGGKEPERERGNTASNLREGDKTWGEGRHHHFRKSDPNPAE